MATPEHNGTILLLALTSWDKKLEIHIPCPDAKATQLCSLNTRGFIDSSCQQNWNEFTPGSTYKG